MLTLVEVDVDLLVLTDVDTLVDLLELNEVDVDVLVLALVEVDTLIKGNLIGIHGLACTEMFGLNVDVIT